MTERWTLQRGARAVPGGVRFEVWARLADAVDVVVESGAAAGSQAL